MVHDDDVARADPRALPANEAAEQALLGAILINNVALDRAGEFLKSEHFFFPAHGRIYAACQRLRERNRVADPVTLRDYFERDGDLQGVGGAQYLAELAAGIVSVINAVDYAHTVYDLYLRRQLIALAGDTATAAYRHDIEVDAVEQVAAAAEALRLLAEEAGRSGPKQAPTMIDEVDAALDQADRVAAGERPMVVSTGIDGLDQVLGGGLMAPDLIILGGRPSAGKTTLAECLALAGVRAGHGVAFFSLEMSRRQLAMKALQRETGIAVSRQMTTLTPDEAALLREARGRLDLPRLVVDDTAALTPSQILARSRAIRRRQGLGLVIIDQLNRMRSDRQARDRYQLLTDIVVDLAPIGRELGVPVVLLAQLSRASTQRDDKRPQLSDLRDTGAIEEAGRVILFIHREEYYLARSEPRSEEGPERYEAWCKRVSYWRGKAELMIAKQHLGPAPATAVVRFDAERQTFSDLDHAAQGYPQ